MIHGLIIHKLIADAYRVSLSQNQRTEQHLRTIKQILQRIHDLDSAPLIEPRIPADRLVGVCRDFAVLLTSILRHKGIPARMRVGFASYLDPEGKMKYDHWITEYWQESEQRWILADAQIDEIRKLYALTPEAKARGYKPGRFSMNTKGGRCEACRGYGTKKVEMHFLPDVWVTCAECTGRRFNRATLEVTYKGKTIADVLEMDVQEALVFFENIPGIARILHTLHDVGLDYLKLGQSAVTLSGGEAQRVKLAKELSRVATGKTLYILDEPATGLHFVDIQRLLDVLFRLVQAGNSVIVIEHNMDVIKCADWIIDLGPEGGEKGGYIVAEGTPEALTANATSYTGNFLAEKLHPDHEI